MFVFDEVNRGEGPRSRSGEPERRSKPRITEPFLARVRGVDASGKAFEDKAKLDNLSVSGLYLRLARRVSVGSRLFFIIWLGSASGEETASLKVATRGVVVREETMSEVDCGIAVCFTRYRIIGS
jgi:hypothetical protein